MTQGTAYFIGNEGGIAEETGNTSGLYAVAWLLDTTEYPDNAEAAGSIRRINYIARLARLSTTKHLA
jgi:hypothetical protein